MLAGLILLQLFLPDWAARPEAWSLDARFTLRGSEQPRQPIVIIALDEASFQMMGELQGENIRTWPRSRWAELVRKIASQQPKVIGLDIVFDTPGWDAGGDAELAQAITEAAASGIPVALAANLEAPIQNMHTQTTYSPPVALLSNAASGVGVAGFPSQVDGGIRQTQLLWGWAGQTLPSLPLVIATLFQGEPVRVDQTELGDDLSLPIHFRGPEQTFQTISMIDLWNGEAPAESLRGVIVLVGYTTQLEQDRHLTPFTGKQKMPGVELQANAIDTLISRDWLREPPSWLPILLVVLAGLFGLGAINLTRPTLGIWALIIGVTAYLLLGAAAFIWADFILPIVAPLTAAIIVGAAALVERMIFAEQDKRLLRQRFAGMMSPERLQAVLDNWDELRQAERPAKEAAVLFADIRDFTRTSETLMRQNRSQEMVQFLSRYLDAMSEAVFKEGGVIYRMLGDGLLIMFGLPEPIPDPALSAVRAAINMSQAATALQSNWPLRDQEPMHMGIGVHLGAMVDAIVGGGRRVDYAIIGDPANTASRIEAHCKVAVEIPRPPGGEVPEFVTILISDYLYEKVSAYILADESIPPFEARGKADPLQVVRVLGLRASSQSPVLR